MSESLLTLPAENEATVVERFTEASKELVPGMQISLARRIVRPGSDQVLCLNATTSVPMQDDEIASVSDLALKLSDGTNVRISLSFFNDSNECQPFNQGQKVTTSSPKSQNRERRQSTYSYDPDRYSMHSVNNAANNQSGITSAMLMACSVALLGLFASYNGPASFNALWAKYKQVASVTPSAKPNEQNKVVQNAPATKVKSLPAVPVLAKATPSAASTVRSKAIKSLVKNMPQVTFKPPTKPHQAKSSFSDLMPASKMMVPPPPVTYTIAPVQLFTPAEIAAMQPAPAVAKTSINSPTRTERVERSERNEKSVKSTLPTALEKSKTQAQNTTTQTESDDDNTVAPNAGLDLFPPGTNTQ